MSRPTKPGEWFTLMLIIIVAVLYVTLVVIPTSHQGGGYDNGDCTIGRTGMCS